MNSRQDEFMRLVKETADLFHRAYRNSLIIKASYTEEFSTGKANDLTDPAGGLDAEYVVDMADVDNFSDFTCGNFINYYEGSTVATGTYGTYTRRMGSF